MGRGVSWEELKGYSGKGRGLENKVFGKGKGETKTPGTDGMRSKGEVRRGAVMNVVEGSMEKGDFKRGVL